MYSWDFQSLIPHIAELAKGLATSIGLLVVAVVPGFALAACLFSARQARLSLMRRLAGLLINGLRALPVLALMVWVFYVLPIVVGHLRLDPFVVSGLALGLNYAALQAENLRVGADAIPRSELEVAQAMGMRPGIVFLRIVLPQASWRSLPAALNQAINTFKLTSLASFISVHELFHATGAAIQTSQRPLEAYTVMAALYLATIATGSVFVGIVERRMLRRFGVVHA